MASLYRMLHKGKVFSPPPAADVLTQTKALTKMPDCVLVNAQEAITEFGLGMIDKEIDFESIPPCTPPFKSMWIEYPGLMASAVFREQIADGFAVRIVIFAYIDNGQPFGPTYIENINLAEDGTFRSFGTARFFVPKENQIILSCHLLDTLHVLARMNCRNVKLQSITEGKLAPHHQRKPVPATVWHEIVISYVPKTQTTGRDGFGRDENLIRSHWVRGHYADYRKNGLFGRPQSRGIYWIPEYKRGNEELGQVIPEYAFA